MAELADTTKGLEMHLEQVQDFTPTPMTVATEIYYSGVHPYTGERIFTATTPEEKLAQRKYFFWYDSTYRPDIIRSLHRLHRTDILDKRYGKNPYANKPAQVAGPKRSSRLERNSSAPKRRRR